MPAGVVSPLPVRSKNRSETNIVKLHWKQDVWLVLQAKTQLNLPYGLALIRTLDDEFAEKIT